MKKPPPNDAQMGLFDGRTFEEDKDGQRLSRLLTAVKRCMQDGEWRTLAEIHRAIGYQGTEASVSARLRDLRKDKFGGYTVERRRRGEPSDGLFEYRVSR